MPSIQTRTLEIFYEEGGPSDGSPILLLHGWPDTARGWNPIAKLLQAQGYRTIAPYLRGTLPTRFLSPSTPRFAAGVALAQDAIDLADALNLQRFAVAGHDWGARAAYITAALFPERLTAIAALALGYQPRGIFTVPDFHQSKRFGISGFNASIEVSMPSTKTLLASHASSGKRGAPQAGTARKNFWQPRRASPIQIGSRPH